MPFLIHVNLTQAPNLTPHRITFLKLEPDTTIRELKQLISEKNEEATAEQLQIFWNGALLSDESTLRGAGVQYGRVLMCINKKPGSNPSRLSNRQPLADVTFENVSDNSNSDVESASSEDIFPFLHSSKSTPHPGNLPCPAWLVRAERNQSAQDPDSVQAQEQEPLNCSACGKQIYGSPVCQGSPLHFGCIDQNKPWFCGYQTSCPRRLRSEPERDALISKLKEELCREKIVVEELQLQREHLHGDMRRCRQEKTEAKYQLQACQDHNQELQRQVLDLRNVVQNLQDQLEKSLAAVEEKSKALQQQRDLRNVVQNLQDQLEKSQTAVEEKSQALQQQRHVVERWRHLRRFDSSPALQPPLADRCLELQIETALQSSWQLHSCFVHSCARMKQARVVEVRPIANTQLWQKYLFCKQAMQEQRAREPGSAALNTGTSLGVLPWIARDASVNECLAFHGTSLDTVDDIASQGFDERCARDSGLYGQGMYFAEEACKSNQYCDEDDEGVRCIIISRILLGTPFFATEPMRNIRRPPLNPSTSRPYDSVIANPGIQNGTPNPQLHREFVLFDRTQAYPELAVYFQL